MRTAIGTLTRDPLPNSRALSCLVNSGKALPRRIPATMHDPTHRERYRSNAARRFGVCVESGFMGMAGSFTPDRLQFLCSIQVLFQKIDIGEATLHAPHQRFMHAVRRRGEGIHHPLALLAFFHQSRATQISEMPGNRRLRRADDLLQFAYTGFALCQQVENPQTSLVGKCFEQLIWLIHFYQRSEERRVGKECRSRWS